MGKQVVVLLGKLRAQGVEVSFHPREGYYGPPEYDYQADDWYPSWGTRNYLGARLGGRLIVGDSVDALVFDCRDERSGNYWALKALREIGIDPYWG